MNMHVNEPHTFFGIEGVKMTIQLQYALHTVLGNLF